VGGKRIISVVTNDLEGDQRIHKTALSLMKHGWEPMLVGRYLRDSQAIQRTYDTRRLKLIFNSGPLFYASINIRLFLFLLFVRVDLILANDLDTLPAAWLVSRIRGKTLVFDSHEYFTEVPELINRPRVQKIWKGIEGFLVPRLKNMITVNEEIASLFLKKYKIQPDVLMNLPLSVINAESPNEVPSGGNQYTQILYQGAVNIGRGLEQMIAAMEYLPDHQLTIVGGGDLLHKLRNKVSILAWKDNIHFTGRLPFEKILAYAQKADIGLSLEQDMGLNYRLSLPNKLFDYMKAGLPVLASDLPVIRQLIKKLDIGLLIKQFDPQYLASAVREMTKDSARYKKWQKNALDAAPDYSWESQEPLLLRIFEEALLSSS
jgi:glycosyltransferase involved in cell wall biosynthesis